VSLTRRKFLRAGAISAISVGVGLAATRLTIGQSGGRQHGPVIRRSAEIPLAAQMEAPFLFNAQTFRPYVGDFFQAPNARGQMIPLKLVSLKTFTPTATGLRLTRSVGESESFSLIFKADARLPLFVAIHKISHPALGHFELFLSERKDDNGTFFYEAVFNHIP
jgi:hypothetical protein